MSIYQLGEGSFPPLKTISNTNLPTPASSFVGRDDELLEVLSRFEKGARLVTLTGPGGTGKTRLAIEAAATLVPELQGWRLLGGAGDAPRSGARHRDDRSDARCQGRPCRAHRRAGAAAAARQPRAGDRGRARAGSAAFRLPKPHPARYIARAPARPGRGRVCGAAAGRTASGGALLRALRTRALRRDRRALPSPRRHAACRRAGRSPREGADASSDPRSSLAAP